MFNSWVFFLLNRIIYSVLTWIEWPLPLQVGIFDLTINVCKNKTSVVFPVLFDRFCVQVVCMTNKYMRWIYYKCACMLVESCFLSLSSGILIYFASDFFSNWSLYFIQKEMYRSLFVLFFYIYPYHTLEYFIDELKYKIFLYLFFFPKYSTKSKIFLWICTWGNYSYVSLVPLIMVRKPKWFDLFANLFIWKIFKCGRSRCNAVHTYVLRYVFAFRLFFNS